MVQKIKFKKSKNRDWKQKSKKIKVQEKQKSKNAVKNTIKETIWKISQNWSLSDQKMPTMRVKQGQWWEKDQYQVTLSWNFKTPGIKRKS